MKKIIIIKVYCTFLILFTGFMVGMSLFSSADFFAAYGIEGDLSFQYSWSFRYLVILMVMIIGLLLNKQETLLITLTARFFVDLFDGFGVFLYNTPSYSHGWLAFHLLALLGPQLIFIIILLSQNIYK